MKTSAKIGVLIVDDSASTRQALQEALASDPQIEVLAVASDPYVAVERIKRRVPDVITMDIELPRMDGLTFLDKIMSQHPIPVVICSTLTRVGSPSVCAAMKKGAVAIVAKPEAGASETSPETRDRICAAVRAAAHSRMTRPPARRWIARPKLSADVVLAEVAHATPVQTTEKVVVVGASTGGTEALRELLEAMPPDSPGIVIVQHMPEKFTAQFAERLDRGCRISVKEAADRDPVTRGLALIAPGNRHLILKRTGSRYFVELRDGPFVCRHRPSVDVLFRSAARYGGKNVVGVIMTGMGDDGARGMLEMKQAGAFNIAQDEHSCVVFGMPAAAMKLGGVDRTMPLRSIAPEVVRLCH